MRTRARILRSAERLFARKGYRGVSLRDLARQCGVRMFTIQHHSLERMTAIWLLPIVALAVANVLPKVPW